MSQKRTDENLQAEKNRKEHIRLLEYETTYYPGIMGNLEFDPEVYEEALTTDCFRLHLELIPPDDYDDKEVIDVLHQYGGVAYGDHISRDIIVPNDIQLWNLHYVIQRAFGWQNSHLHEFSLPDETIKKLTDNKAGNWANLVGFVFRSPFMDEEELFWNDDYDHGSIKTWLRKKYTGPYESECYGEDFWKCQDDVWSYIDLDLYAPQSKIEGGMGKKRNNRYVVYYTQFENLEKPIYCHPEGMACPIDFGSNWSPTISKKETLAFKDLPVDALSYLCDGKHTRLLERLEVDEIIIHGGDGLLEDGYEKEFPDDEYCDDYEEFIDEAVDSVSFMDPTRPSPENQPMLLPFTKELIYTYDYGDSWKVRISTSMNCVDLVESGRITQEDLEEATLKCLKTYRPVMIARDGIDLVDDLGGYHAIPSFLRAINGEPDGNPYDDKKETLDWAKSLGWSNRKIALKNRL